MPSFTTAGLDTYASVWNTATGESPTLSSASANPNGVSATATYTSTQSDLDTYGNNITLEIQQPIIVDQGYSFVSSCPADVPEQEPTVTGFVTVMTVSVQNLRGSFGTIKINNAALSGAPTARLETTRYIFSDISPSLVPQPSTGNLYFVRDASNTFIGNVSGYETSVVYRPENALSRGTNIVTYESFDKKDMIQVAFSRHPVLDVNGTSYILGNADGVSLQHFKYQFMGQGISNKFTMQFDGGNTNEFSNASYIKHKTGYPDESGTIGISYVS